MLNSLSTEEVAAPLASLARTLALPQTSVSRQCLSLRARQPGSQEPSLLLRCRLSCLHRGTQGRYPRRPSPGPNPDRGTPFPRGSRLRTWSGRWARWSAFPAPPARQLPFDKPRQPSTWPRPSLGPAPGSAPSRGPAEKTCLAGLRRQRRCNHLDSESTTGSLCPGLSSATAVHRAGLASVLSA